MCNIFLKHRCLKLFQLLDRDAQKYYEVDVFVLEHRGLQGKPRKQRPRTKRTLIYVGRGGGLPSEGPFHSRKVN